MSTVNKSTGYSLFQLCFGRSPQVLPPLATPPPSASVDHISACKVIESIARDVTDARDNLMLAKITESFHANSSKAEDPKFKVGDLIMLSTLNR